MGNEVDNVLIGLATLSIRQPNDALAMWSTVQKYTGSYSARLSKGGSGNAGSTHIQITPPTGKTVQNFLDDPTDYSFYYWYNAVTGNFCQYELKFEDPDSDAWMEVTVMVHQNTLGVGPTTGWQKKALALTDSIGFGGVGEEGQSFFNYDLSDTIAEVVSAPNDETGVTSVAEWVLTRVRLELWEATPERIAYVDSIEIDGVTYTVEPGGTGPEMSLSSPYVDVGYTEDGVTFNYTSEVTDSRVEEETYPIAARLASENMEIVCNLVESSLANINNAIPGSVLSGNILTLGAGVMKEMSIKLTGLTPDGDYIRTYEFPRVVAVGPVSMAFRRMDKTVFPITLRCLKPSSGPVGTFVDTAV